MIFVLFALALIPTTRLRAAPVRATAPTAAQSVACPDTGDLDRTLGCLDAELDRARRKRAPLVAELGTEANEEWTAYADGQCEFEAGLRDLTPTARAVVRARCLIRITSDTTSTAEAIATGTAWTRIRPAHPNARTDVIDRLDALSVRLNACMRAAGNDGASCARDVFLDARGLYDELGEPWKQALAHHPAGFGELKLHVDSQRHFIAYRNAFCRTVAARRPSGQTADAFRFGCLSELILIRSRELFAN